MHLAAFFGVKRPVSDRQSRSLLMRWARPFLPHPRCSSVPCSSLSDVQSDGAKARADKTAKNAGRESRSWEMIGFLITFAIGLKYLFEGSSGGTLGPFFIR
jgi:hypothetical protein